MESRAVLALDQARSTGWALYIGGGLKSFGVLELGKPNELYESLLLKARRCVKEHVEALGVKVDLVVLEDIQMQSQNVVTYKKLAMLLGVLISLFLEMEIEHVVVPPTRWKSYNKIAGKKRAEQKSGTLAFVRETFGLDDITEDMADAIALGWYAVNQETEAIL